MKDFIDVYLESMKAEEDPFLTIPQLIGICMDFFEGRSKMTMTTNDSSNDPPLGSSAATMEHFSSRRR